MKDKDIIDLLGLGDTSIQLELVQDIEKVVEVGIKDYLKEMQEKVERKKEFIKLFKECYDELCVFMENDKQKRVAISCYTCQKGLDLSKQYGKYIK